MSHNLILLAIVFALWSISNTMRGQTQLAARNMGYSSLALILYILVVFVQIVMDLYKRVTT